MQSILRSLFAACLVASALASPALAQARQPAGAQALLASGGGVNLLPLGIPAVIGPGNVAPGGGFSETFDTNLANWTANSSGPWTIDAGAATVTGTTSGRYFYLTRAGATYANLDYRVVMHRTVSQNSANAIYFRAEATPEDDSGDIAAGYWFAYSNARLFTVWKLTVGGNWIVLKPWTGTVIINPNDTNELRVVAFGSSLTFFINGSEVFATTDASLAAGQVGFGMYDGDGGTLRVLSATLTTPAADAATTLPTAGQADLPANAEAKHQSP
ncbi:MAG: family 16 glycoside hydrolase [Acidobacteriota bacterium]